VGLPGIVLVAISVSLSAMTYWAITFHVDGSRLPPEGLIPTLIGTAGTVVSAFVFNMSRSSELTHHTFDRQLLSLDGGGRPIHQGIEKLTLRELSSATTRPPHQEQARARGTRDGRNGFDAAREYVSRH